VPTARVVSTARCISSTRIASSPFPTAAVGAAVGDGPGWIVAVGRVAATSADGRTSFERPQACVAEFRDGRFVRGRVFGDPAEADVWARDIAAERAPGAIATPDEAVALARGLLAADGSDA